jgi:hypothetical protein
MISSDGSEAKNGGEVMARMVRLSAPTQGTFLVSLVIAIFALIAFLVKIPNVSPHAFWIAIIAYVVLAVGCALKGV